jgi:hypothetical protein
MIQLLGAFSLLMSLSTAGLFYLYDGEKEDRIQAEAALGQVTLTLEVERENMQRQAENLLALNLKTASIQSETDVLINQLNGYRSREKLLQKKPKTIERLANAATRGVFNDILRASSGGDDKDSTTDPVTDSNDID